MEEEDEDQTRALRNENPATTRKPFCEICPLMNFLDGETLKDSFARSRRDEGSGKMYLLCSFRFKSDAAFSI